MKKIFSLLLLALSLQLAQAQDNITDSIDVLHYDLRLDLGNKSFKRIEGSAALTMRILRPVSAIALELTYSDVDSVWVDGIASPFLYAAPLLSVPFQGSAGDTTTVTVFYRKGQYLAAEGWGGFYFDNNIYYNLGIALYEYPHNMGKSWFPCRDNFYDKATYSLQITSQPGWRAFCSGMPLGETANPDGSLTSSWSLIHPTPTYLVGVASAPFHLIQRSYQSLYGTYPALLAFLNHDSLSVFNAYQHLSAVIPMFEQCFGPYRWDRVGYVSTPKGSMEHVGNIAFTTYCMASAAEPCLATMSHEFAHSWFGNLLTCASSENMWINEGGASFCEEVAIQAIAPAGDSLRYKGFADENLNSVLCSSHVRDGGFKALYGVTPDITYGSTVYNKGATVWHSLRGYLGDSLFYASLRQLFSRCAFANIDSYQLRDSLSAYSGIDLSAFFDFHVFQPGFNDYTVESLTTDDDGQTSITLRQQHYGTDAFMDRNRVWVSFFGDQLQHERRLLSFDGSLGQASFSLPFRPLFAVVDFDKALSKASIGTQITVNNRGTFEFPVSHFACNVRKAADTNSAWLYVSHHWYAPQGDTSPRFIRMADRYWSVDGILPSTVQMSGWFHYCRSGDEATLDNDLIPNADTFALVRLLYRPDAQSPWTVASSHYDGNSLSGYFIANNLKLGQYTLAVIDTAYVGIAPVPRNAEKLKLFPNPTADAMTILSDIPGQPLSVSAVDASGREVFTGRVRSGVAFRTGLPSGFYLFRIASLDGSINETIKVQIKNF